MKSEKLQQLVTAAMFAALCFLGTFIIKIPTFHGYIHLGDCMVLLSGLLLGPLYGGLAAGIGSMLSDILAGYISYAPGTFLIKLLAASLCAIIFKSIQTHVKSEKGRATLSFLSGIAGGIIVVIGYLFYEYSILGYGAGAFPSIFTNIIQATTGAVLSTILYPVLLKIPYLRHQLHAN